MSIAPILTIYGPSGNSLPAPATIPDSDGDLTGSYGEEFIHQVYTIQTDCYHALLFGVDFVRKHEPLTVVKQIDKTSILLIDYLNKGIFLPKAEIRWYQYNDKKSDVEEYFRMTLEHVRLHRIRYLLPDVKDKNVERYGHLEELQLMYQKITWLYTKGYLLFTDIWNGGFYNEEDEKNFSGKKEDQIEAMEEMPLEEKLELKFTSGVFSEPKSGFNFDRKATVTFTFTANRNLKPSENKVYAKLFAVCNGKTEDLRQINEGRLIVGNNWSTDFVLRKPTAYADTKPVEYYAEIENAYAGRYRSTAVCIGSSGISLQSMSWKSPAARRDELVSLVAEFTGCKGGETAVIEIYEFDRDGKHDFMEKIESGISGGKVEAEWKFIYQEDTDDIMTEEEAKKNGNSYCPPEYFFTIEIGQQKWGDKQESGLLQFKDWIEVELQDEKGNVVANEPFELRLPNGTTHKGTLDENGFARVESVPPGPVEVIFVHYPSVTIKK